MHSKTHFKWLKKEKLLEAVTDNSKYFEKVLKQCLKAKKEKVLIIGDRGFFNHQLAGMISASYYLAAKKLKLKPSLVIQEPRNKGDPAGKEVVQSLKDLPEESIIIATVSNVIGKLGGVTKSFRKFAAIRGHRFISSSGLGALDNSYYNFIVKCLNVNYKELRQRATKLKQLLDNNDLIHVKTEAGTNLKLNIHAKSATKNDGNFKIAGIGGNMPSGEVYVPVRRGGAEGKIVIDGSVRHRKGTELLKEPIEMTIKKGRVVNIKDGIPKELIEQSFAWAEERAKYPQHIRKLCEFGIGLNPNAKIIGLTSIDEKTFGSGHIAFGSNSWFGGDIYTIVHFDHVFKNPTVIIGKKKVVDKGKFLI
jgi:hypothetical protein